MKTIDRRTLLLGLAAAALAAPSAALAQRRARITMWKDPNCGCCNGWAQHAERVFGPVRIVPTADMSSFKRNRGVPEDLWSCHTSEIDGYVIEGHVPAADIQRLLASRDRSIVGLAAPGMPLGSPGMEAGGRRQRYQVIAFRRGNRRSVFATHG